MTRIALVLSAAFLLVSIDVEAQMRRDRSGSPREQRERDNPKTPATASAAEQPFAALERELPSLKVDLKLTADQVNAWSVFERDVRDLAEMDRARRKHLMSLREDGQKPPTAVAMIATLVEEDRLKAEATGELKAHLDALYARLDDTQRSMLDRRVALSQTEPLGR
jgi:LTXXQ motif family protein